MTDRELLQQYRAGAEEAFGAILQRHAGTVHSVCLRVLGRKADAEDASQAVFLLLVKKGRKLPDSTRFAGWLHRAAEFVARDVSQIHGKEFWQGAVDDISCTTAPSRERKSRA